ncbi:MAG: hypothetical protein IT245_04235 [Bacteroidia bacterium]|nr:hypothetical protein [Bacteroidia bacterium]
MRSFLLALTLFVLPCSFAQLRNPALSFSVEPTISNRIMSFKSRYPKTFKDSINKADKYRDALSFNLHLSFSTSKNSRIFVGLHFLNLGFTRMKYNLKFKDTIHSEIGIVNDLSQTGSNDVEYNHRYQYIGLPFMFSSRLHIKKLKTSQLHFMFGGSVVGLVNHDIKVRLIGFSAFGKKEYKLSGDENEPIRFNANLQIGLRLENPLFDEHTFIFVQPDLYLPIISANRSDMKAQLYAFGLQVGCMFRLENDRIK